MNELNVNLISELEQIALNRIEENEKIFEKQKKEIRKKQRDVYRQLREINHKIEDSTKKRDEEAVGVLEIQKNYAFLKLEKINTYDFSKERKIALCSLIANFPQYFNKELIIKMADMPLKTFTRESQGEQEGYYQEGVDSIFIRRRIKVNEFNEINIDAVIHEMIHSMSVFCRNFTDGGNSFFEEGFTQVKTDDVLSSNIFREFCKKYNYKPFLVESDYEFECAVVRILNVISNGKFLDMQMQDKAEFFKFINQFGDNFYNQCGYAYYRRADLYNGIEDRKLKKKFLVDGYLKILDSIMPKIDYEKLEDWQFIELDKARNLIEDVISDCFLGVNEKEKRGKFSFLYDKDDNKNVERAIRQINNKYFAKIDDFMNSSVYTEEFCNILEEEREELEKHCIVLKKGDLNKDLIANYQLNILEQRLYFEQTLDRFIDCVERTFRVEELETLTSFEVFDKAKRLANAMEYEDWAYEFDVLTDMESKNYVKEKKEAKTKAKEGIKNYFENEMLY